MKSQSGYITWVLTAFALVVGIMIFPLKFPVANPNDDCQVGEAPSAYDQEVTGLPSSISADSADYVLIRKNVLTGFEFNIHIGLVKENVKPGYDLYFPDTDMAKETSTDSFHPHPEGLVFFVNNDPAAAKKALRADVNKGGVMKDSVTGAPITEDVRLVDVYQNKTVYKGATELGNRSYNDPAEMFECWRIETATSTPWLTVPKQDVSDKKDQLQLEWFLFDKQAVWGVHCKPAVYLYPEKKQIVNVKVFPKGELSYTDPPYDRKIGWSVYAHPDGRLLNYPNLSAIPNNYLYYESRLFDSEIEIPDTGWVVRGGSRAKSQGSEEMEELFNEILPKLGLNTKEKKDFEEYWLKTLPKSPYYYVGLIDKNQRDYLERLDVIPSPDTSIRFSLFFEPLEERKTVKEPEIITPIRKGFTLVDWGGMIKLHKDTPFTCSQ